MLELDRKPLASSGALHRALRQVTPGARVLRMRELVTREAIAA
jgi:hypothetical protein